MVDYIRSDATKRAGLPFSDAVRVGDVLYLSGQMGVKPGTKELMPGGVTAQARQAMDNIGATLAANGLTFDAIFKVTVMLADMSDWPAFNEIYVGYFKARPAAGALRLRRQRPGAQRPRGDRGVGVGGEVRGATPTTSGSGAPAAPALPALTRGREGSMPQASA